MAAASSPLRFEPKTLLVSERFVSLQGEGLSAGAPAAFLRLGQCNLSCGFCDTPYTWDDTRFDLSAELKRISFDKLTAWIAEECPGRLIITGGEPLIQQKALGEWIAAVDAQLESQAKTRPVIEVETNGTVPPTAALRERIDQWNISPKLSNSGEPALRALRSEALAQFASLKQASFKFVVATAADAAEANVIIEEYGLNRARVLFMPLASDADALRRASPEVASLALRSRVRFSSRLHLELFGGGRGV
jgi:7-carboxy-7-deazaguanine synthase